MNVNFEIEFSNAIIFNECLLDIHNNYDFIGYNYQSDDREFILTFRRSSSDWAAGEKYEGLRFFHKNVHFLKIQYDNNKYEFPTDDAVLNDITYYPSTEREVNDSMTLQPKPNDQDDILYIFQSNSFIRVGCDTIVLVAG